MAADEERAMMGQEKEDEEMEEVEKKKYGKKGGPKEGTSAWALQQARAAAAAKVKTEFKKAVNWQSEPQ
eukprot:9761773-Alexandrium_andersonii.AAC.1